MRNLLFISVLLLLFSCKKEKLPEEIIESPVFYLNSEINHENVLFEAGRQGYYMETDYITTDSSIEMIGKLQDLDSVGSKRYVELIFSSLENHNANNPIDSVFLPGELSYYYNGERLRGHLVNFTSLINNPALDLTYLWDFGDGTTSTEINPQHLYNFEAGVFKYEACLSVSSAGTSCSSQICSDVVFPGYPSWANFNYTNNGLFYSYTGNPLRGIKPFTYEWNFKKLDMPVYSQRVDYNYVNFPDKGVDQVCLTVTDAAGRPTTQCKNVAVDPSVSCVANFNSFALPLSSYPTERRFVIIKYHDGKGGVYTSDLSQQPSSSFFKLLNSQNYLTDRKGNKTKSLEIQLDCVLKKGNESLLLKVNNGVVAVAHP